MNKTMAAKTVEFAMFEALVCPDFCSDFGLVCGEWGSLARF